MSFGVGTDLVWSWNGYRLELGRILAEVSPYAGGSLAVCLRKSRCVLIGDNSEKNGVFRIGFVPIHIGLGFNPHGMRIASKVEETQNPNRQTDKLESIDRKFFIKA